MAETVQNPTSPPETTAQVAAGCAAVVAELADYLRYRAECGERAVEIDNEAVSSLFARPLPSRPITPPPVAQSHSKTLAATPSVSKPTRPPSAQVSPAAAANAPTDPAAVSSELANIAAAIGHCRNCNLCQGRNKVVPGQGNANVPDVMFIGEAPGADEDRQGLAFVGLAGQLLTKMIAAMGYAREEVFIANICKCRPPGNRAPTPEEMAACIPFLKRQIQLVRPKTIVALGNTACIGLLGQSGITRLRGHWTSFEGIPVMPTFHPAYLLRFPPAKREAWVDLKLVMARLGSSTPLSKPKSGISA